MTDVGRWDEGAMQQTGTCQCGQPLGIGHIGLATRHVFDMPCVDDPGDDALTLQRCKGAFPVDARTLHHHNFRPKLPHPLRQRPSVTLEAAKLTHLYLHTPITLFAQGAGANFGLVNVQAYDTPKDWVEFHHSSPLTKTLHLSCVLSPRGTAIQRPVGICPTALFNVRCPSPLQVMPSNPGYE